MIRERLLHIGKNPNKARPWAGKYDSFHTINSLWVWGQAAQPQENVEIYTLIYVWKQYFQLSN